MFVPHGKFQPGEHADFVVDRLKIFSYAIACGMRTRSDFGIRKAFAYPCYDRSLFRSETVIYSLLSRSLAGRSQQCFG